MQQLYRNFHKNARLGYGHIQSPARAVVLGLLLFPICAFSQITVSPALPTDTDGTLSANSDSKVATQKATKTYADTKQTALGFTPIRNDYILIVDSEGVADGGTFTSGAWQARTLNTIKVDTASIATNPSSTTFTLPAGTYRMHAAAPGLQVGSHQVRIFNVTDSSVVAYGTSEYSDNNALYASTTSHAWTRVTISGTKTFRLEHQCSNTKSSNGFGGGNAFTSENIFAVLEIWRE